MKKFRFRMTRDITESVFVTVSAETIADALSTVLLSARDGEFEKYADLNDSGAVAWKQDDYVPGDEQIYCPDEDDYEEIEDGP